MDTGPSVLIGNQKALTFIHQHEGDDPYTLSLKHREVNGVPIAIISRQIESRQKARLKLPEWYETPGVIFPDPINLQQSSSEATARYKIRLLSAGLIVDLTGGTGVDSHYLMDQKEGIFVEPDEELCRLANHNFSLLGGQIKVHNQSAESFVNSIPVGAQVFLDPSRRDAARRKTVLFSDCSPDVTTLLPILLEKTDRVLIKGSPMLDLQLAISSLAHHVAEIHVLEWMGECRESLFLCTPEKTANPTITAVNTDTAQSFTFTSKEEEAADIKYSGVQNWLYEPSPSMMKSGGFKTMARQFGLSKLQVNTHLYTSNEPIQNFPGRIFEVENCEPFSIKTLKKYSEKGRANITIRNFPESVASIRKKSGIRDGGDVYLFAYTSAANKRVLCKVRKPDF